MLLGIGGNQHHNTGGYGRLNELHSSASISHGMYIARRVPSGIQISNSVSHAILLRRDFLRSCAKSLACQHLVNQSPDSAIYPTPNDLPLLKRASEVVRPEEFFVHIRPYKP